MADNFEIQLLQEIANAKKEMAAMQGRIASLREHTKGLQHALQTYRRSQREVKTASVRPNTQRAVVLQLLEEVWPNGLRVSEVIKMAEKRGEHLNEVTVASHLSRAAKAGLVKREHLQRYVRPPGGFDASEGKVDA